VFTQHFIIEGRYLGQVERKFDLTSGMPPLSILLYCEYCGEVWAKFPVEGQPFLAYRRLCRKCPTPHRSHLPGSVILSWDKELTAALPFPVLLWEMQRELDYIDKDL
jgi:hypothetical protein